MTLQWLLPVLRIKPQGPWGSRSPGSSLHQALTLPSWGSGPTGCPSVPLRSLCLRAFAHADPALPDSSTPPLGAPIDLPLSAVSPSTGVSRLWCSVPVSSLSESGSPEAVASRPKPTAWLRPGTPPPTLPPCPWLSPSAHQALPGPSRVQVGVRGVGRSVGGRAARRVPQGGGGPGGRAADLRSGWSRRACSRGGRDTGSCPGS